MSIRTDIESVANALGDLKERCFLTGGASIPFYITDTMEEQPRVTLDIDVVIEVKSGVEFREKIETGLRMRGFANDTTEGAPICRWKLGSIIVDIMPTVEMVLGFSNPWYQAGMASLIPVSITKKCDWRVLSPPFALAAKLAAFWNRGRKDPGRSEDLEDIVTLLNGRPSLPAEIAAASLDCKRFLSESFSEILVDRKILDVVPHHLPPGETNQQRLPWVLERMRKISESHKT